AKAVLQDAAKQNSPDAAAKLLACTSTCCDCGRGCVVGGPTASEAVVMPPFSPEQRAAACVAACEGLPDHALFGGWTAAGLSCYAKSLEGELAALKASLTGTRSKDLQVAADLWLLTRAKDAPHPDQWTALDVTAAYVAGAVAEHQRREGQS
ncbi:MAG: hypothetical protein IIZ92_28715, partial [Aquincola sp.]|nr:hypothetical protein [Aquincola sp.]